METISNEFLTVSIDAVGAEVHSVKRSDMGREYIWHGDERWWGGHSPILFPIVGGMWNGKCRYGNTELSIPKHGFLRRARWHVADRKADSIRFEFTSTVATFAVYPFAFCVAVTYRLEGSRLFADFEVKNLGSCDLLFQIGGHPAIELPDWSEEEPVDGFLRLEGNPEYLWRAGDQGCLEREKHPVPFNAEGLVNLEVGTFANEALIFDNHQIQAAEVLDKQKNRIARIESTAPVWLFWSPQGQHSPFVCAEPWYGLCDHQHFEGQMADRPFMNCAPSGETWTGGYDITFF